MARRGDNIRKRKDGRWEGRFRIPGERKPHSVYAHSFEECKRKRLAALRAYQPTSQNCEMRGVPASGSALLHAGEAWLAFIRANRKGSTYSKYRYLYRKYIEAALGNHTDGAFDCNREIFNRYGVTAWSVKRCCLTILNGIARYAAGAGILPPGRFSVKGDYEARRPKPVETFTKAEQAALLKVLFEDPDPWKMGIFICLSTGLRLGELCAVKWQDIDLRSGILHVNRTVQRLASDGSERKTHLVESTPKSDCSLRDIPLSDEILGLLRKFERSGEYLIGGRHPADPRTYEYRFHRYQIKAGIVPRNFHVLRHTFATNCVNNGMNAKIVSELLGHSDVRITLNRYVHPSMDAKRASMNALSAVYGQIRGQENRAA